MFHYSPASLLRSSLKSDQGEHFYNISCHNMTTKPHLCVWFFNLIFELSRICPWHTSVCTFRSLGSSIAKRNSAATYTYLLSKSLLVNWSPVHDNRPPCRHTLGVSNLSPSAERIWPIYGVFDRLMGKRASLLNPGRISLCRACHLAKSGMRGSCHEQWYKSCCLTYFPRCIVTLGQSYMHWMS